MNYLQTFSSSGALFTPLLWGLLFISIAVVVVISLLIPGGTLLRKAARPEIATAPAISRNGSGYAWIGIGVGISTLLLLATMVWTVETMAAMTHSGNDAALTIEVVGHQWWWEFRYLSDDPSRAFVTANELHIPVGEPVQIRLVSGDVIHSFWVPSLAGKTDTIPGQTNIMYLDADHVGVYRGQCSEYCGEQHAHMALLAFADSPAEFETWLANQAAPATVPADADQASDQAAFVAHCGRCHTVRGTPADGKVGPDLTHLMTRTTIAAGTTPNTEAYLAGWIANPQTIKPGNLMPNPDLSGPDLTRVLAFLEAQK